MVVGVISAMNNPELLAEDAVATGAATSTESALEVEAAEEDEEAEETEMIPFPCTPTSMAGVICALDSCAVVAGIEVGPEGGGEGGSGILLAVALGATELMT